MGCDRPRNQRRCSARLLVRDDGAVFGCGAGATAFRYAGGEATFFEAPPGRDYYGIARYRGDVYFGAGGEGVDRLDEPEIVSIKPEHLWPAPARRERKRSLVLRRRMISIYRFDGTGWLRKDFNLILSASVRSRKRRTFPRSRSATAGPLPVLQHPHARTALPPPDTPHSAPPRSPPLLARHPQPVEMRLQPLDQPRQPLLVHVRVLVRVQQVLVVDRPQERRHLGVLADDLGGSTGARASVQVHRTRPRMPRS